MVPTNVEPLAPSFTAMDGAEEYPDSRDARTAAGAGSWTYGHYLPRFPASIDCGTADPEIQCAAVLGYN
jgi:hypothetical protein